MTNTRNKNTLYSSLIVIFILISVSSCDTKPPLDSENIAPIRVGDVSMRVPVGYLETNLNLEEFSDGEYIVDTVTILGTAPLFHARSDANENLFRSAGSDGTIRVQVRAVYGRSLAEVYPNIRSNFTKGKIIETSISGNEVFHVVEGDKFGSFGSRIGDVIYAADGSITSCGRIEPPIRSPKCKAVFVLGESIIIASYGRKWIDDRDQIKNIVTEYILNWSNFGTENAPAH